MTHEQSICTVRAVQPVPEDGYLIALTPLFLISIRLFFYQNYTTSIENLKLGIQKQKFDIRHSSSSMKHNLALYGIKTILPKIFGTGGMNDAKMALSADLWPRTFLATDHNLALESAAHQLSDNMHFYQIEHHTSGVMSSTIAWGSCSIDP